MKTIEILCYKNGFVANKINVSKKIVKQIVGKDFDILDMDAYSQIELDNAIVNVIKELNKNTNFDEFIIFNDYTDSIIKIGGENNV